MVQQMIEIRNKEIAYKDENGQMQLKYVLQYRVEINQWMEYLSLIHI